MDEDHRPVSRLQRIGITLGFTTLLMTLYLVIGWFLPDDARLYVVPTRVDDWVPFSLLWLPMYIFMMPMSWAPACTFVYWDDFRRWVVSAVLLYIPAVPLWYHWPVTVPRTAVPVDDFWTFGLAVLRTVDPPVNCLPSMHVAVATLAGLVIRRVDPIVGRRVLVLIPLIWYSTMALDQHWFVDGLVGVVLAIVVEAITHRAMPRPRRPHAYIERGWHWIWMGAFCALMIGSWLYWLFSIQ